VAAEHAAVHVLARYLAEGGEPLHGPGGEQRIQTLRGGAASAAPQLSRALLTSPRDAESGAMCLRLRGHPGATLELAQPRLERIEPLEGPQPPNLLVVVVDALRADAIGPYGAGPEASPALDRFAHQARAWDNTWTQYTWTGPSFVSYMSSRWARSHGWTASWADRGAVKPRPGAEIPTLPTVLRDAGYLTVGLNANGYLDWLDASQLGFDQWSYEGDTPALKAALRELSHWSSDGRPNLLYLHLMATHHPLCPSGSSQESLGLHIDPALYKGRDNKCPRGGLTQIASDYPQLSEEQHLALYREAYRGATLDADRAFGRLLEGLDEHGLRDNTVVVFTSDHGELLGEHGRNGHGPWVWEPLTRVPLLMAGPGIEPGREQQRVARLIDLAPTLLELVGLSDRQPEAWQGQSLLAPPEGTPLAVSEREELVAYTLDGRRKRIDHAATGVPVGLYDLAEDPRELRGLKDGEAPGFEELHERSRAWAAETPRADSPEGQGDERLGEVLEALGYVEPSQP
jgi:arylsulfatase A-like enzyme